MLIDKLNVNMYVEILYSFGLLVLIRRCAKQKILGKVDESPLLMKQAVG